MATLAGELGMSPSAIWHTWRYRTEFLAWAPRILRAADRRALRTALAMWKPGALQRRSGEPGVSREAEAADAIARAERIRNMIDSGSYASTQRLKRRRAQHGRR